MHTADLGLNCQSEAEGKGSNWKYVHFVKPHVNAEGVSGPITISHVV